MNWKKFSIKFIIINHSPLGQANIFLKYRWCNPQRNSEPGREGWVQYRNIHSIQKSVHASSVLLFLGLSIAEQSRFNDLVMRDRFYYFLGFFISVRLLFDDLELDLIPFWGLAIMTDCDQKKESCLSHKCSYNGYLHLVNVIQWSRSSKLFQCMYLRKSRKNIGWTATKFSLYFWNEYKIQYWFSIQSTGCFVSVILFDKY